MAACRLHAAERARRILFLDWHLVTAVALSAVAIVRLASGTTFSGSSPAPTSYTSATIVDDEQEAGSGAGGWNGTAATAVPTTRPPVTQYRGPRCLHPWGQLCGLNHACVYGSRGCDGVIDCADGRDEVNCDAYWDLRNCSTPGREGWLSHGHFCYYFGITFTNYDGAVAHCRQYDSELASIHREEEVRFLAQTVDILRKRNAMHAYRYWIGLREVDAGTYAWTDGTPVNFLHWAPGEPKPIYNEKCVEMYREGTWNDESCRQAAGFICKVPEGNHTHDICKTPTWRAFNGSRYMLVYDQDTTWYNAENSCFRHDAQLASISSEAERVWITDVLLAAQKGDYSAWIQDPDASSATSTSFEYSEYTEQSMIIRHCPMIVKDRAARLYGSLRNGSCFRQTGFICEIDDAADVRRPTRTPCVIPFTYKGKLRHGCVRDPRTAGFWCSLTANFDVDGRAKVCDELRCPPEWWRYGALCYHVPPHRDTWAEAKVHCEYAGGGLAEIRGPKTLHFFFQKMKERDVQALWIGSRSKLTMNDSSSTPLPPPTGSMWTNHSQIEGVSPFDIRRYHSCRIVIAASSEAHPEIIALNCTAQKHFACRKPATIAEDASEHEPRESVQAPTSAERSSEDRYSATTLYSTLGIVCALTVLILLSWAVYLVLRRNRSRRGSLNCTAAGSSDPKSEVLQ